MLSENEYIFELCGDTIKSNCESENNIEPSVNCINTIFEIEEIENGVEQLSIQKDSYKNLDDAIQIVKNEISVMCLEHNKENQIYDLLKKIALELKSSCISELEKILR